MNAPLLDRTRRTLLAGAALVALVHGTLAAEPGPYRWSRPLELPVIAEPTLAAVPLDTPIFAATIDGLTDLKLRNPGGEAVAYVLRRAPTTKQHKVHKSWIARQRGAKPLDSGGLEVILELDKDSPLPHGLKIVTPLRDFEHQVQVFSSADGMTWVPASTPGVIFDYSRFVDVRNVSSPMDGGANRQFRLVIDDVTAEQASRLLELTRRLRGGEEVERSERTTIDRRPFRVDRIEFYRDDTEMQADGVQTRDYETSDFSVSEDPKNKQTTIEFQSQREPLTSLRLKTDATNFSRAATVQVAEPRGNQTAWRTIGSGTLSRFSFEAIKKDDLAIAFPEQRGEKYKVVLQNRDSPPLAIEGVEVAGPVYQLVFLATPGNELTLDYGSPAAPKLSFDTAAVQKLLAAGQAPRPIELAAAVENVVSPPRPQWLKDTRVVLGVIVGLTVLLGWSLYRASRRLESVPPR